MDERRALKASLLAPLICFGAAALAMLPVLGAGFHPEDSGWLALARLLRSPLPLLTQNIDFVYFYRPVPLLFWWVTGHVFGTDAAWHNALDLLLHAANAALICVLAMRLSGQRLPGVIAGLVFASLPAGAGTAAWMADRFDPVALAFSLLALLAFEAALTRRRSPLWAALFLLLALLSKEVAYATAALMLAWSLWRGLTRREWPLVLAGATVCACATALLLRAITATTLGTSLDIADPVQTFFAGVGAWWLRAPAALSGFQPASSVWMLLAGLIAVLALVGGVRDRKHGFALAGSGAVLLLSPSLLQWPITALALTDAAGLAFSENLRFYYLATAGFALLAAAACAPMHSHRLRAVAIVVCLALGAHGFLKTHQLMLRWAQAWRPQSDAFLRLATELGARDFPRGCRIYLDAPDWQGFTMHADTIVKAFAAPQAPVQACAVFAGTQIYQTFVPVGACDAANWPGLAFAESKGVVLRQRLGDLCITQFTAYRPDTLGAPLLRFRVDAHGHLRESVGGGE